MRRLGDRGKLGGGEANRDRGQARSWPRLTGPMRSRTNRTRYSLICPRFLLVPLERNTGVLHELTTDFCMHVDDTTPNIEGVRYIEFAGDASKGGQELQRGRNRRIGRSITPARSAGASRRRLPSKWSCRSLRLLRISRATRSSRTSFEKLGGGDVPLRCRVRCAGDAPAKPRIPGGEPRGGTTRVSKRIQARNSHVTGRRVATPSQPGCRPGDADTRECRRSAAGKKTGRS